MGAEHSPESGMERSAPMKYPLVLFLAFSSGTAALIYEVVWFHLLELVIGSSAISLGILLATFMGGTCLGNVLFPRVIAESRHPLRVYAALEVGIGVAALLTLVLLPIVGPIYFAWGGEGTQGLLLRGMLAAACLFIPTLLMGATLPALSRFAAKANKGFSLGLLYGSNVLGAVSGSLLSGFYLLRHYDVTTTTLAAAGINAIVGAAAMIATWQTSQVGFRKIETESSVGGPEGRKGPPQAPRQRAASRSDREGGPNAKSRSDTRPADMAIYIVIALSGFCALAAEAIWTRTLGLLLGGSVYTFSIVLAVFLVGLGLGSSIGSLLSPNLTSPRRALGWCQLFAAAGVAWTSYNLSASLPYWPINPSLSTSIWFNFQLHLDLALWALLPPTIFWGASFSFALEAARGESRDNGRVMANVYAANTVGAILGALATTLVLIASFGSQWTQQFLIATSGVAALIALFSVTLRRRIVAAIVTFAVVTASTRAVPPLSELLVAHGRYSATWANKSDILYAAEGLNADVAVSSFSSGALTFHVAGKIQASSVPRDMRLQRMLGHLTSLTAKNPESVLVIGCGAGITAGAVAIDPRVQRLALVEIEPLVPQTAATFFGRQNFDVVTNPKVHLHIDDGRHFLLTAKEKFDAITADPLDPWVKGAANLYTREFFEAARDHLKPGGVLSMYIQLFATNADAVKSAVATFFEVFPHGTIWGNTYEGRGHDMILLGSVEPMQVDLFKFEERLRQPDYARVAQSLLEVEMKSPVELFATYAGRASDLTGWLKDAQINRDRNLRMQYLAGAALDADESATIYAEMLRYRRFPEDLFTGPENSLNFLRAGLTPGQR